MQDSKSVETTRDLRDKTKFPRRTTVRLILAFVFTPFLSALIFVPYGFNRRYSDAVDQRSFPEIIDVVLGLTASWALFLGYPLTMIAAPLALWSLERSGYRSFFAYVATGLLTGAVLGLLFLGIGIFYMAPYGTVAAGLFWLFVWIGRDRQREPFWV